MAGALGETLSFFVSRTTTDMWARAIAKTLPLPLIVLFVQAMVKLWPVSSFYVVMLSIFFLLFYVSAMVVLDDYERLLRKSRR